MKKKILFTIVSIALLFIMDYLLYLISVHYSKHSVIGKFCKLLYFLGVLSLVFLLLQNFMYKTLYSFKSSKIKIVLAIGVSLLFSLHISDRLLTINDMYFDKKNRKVVKKVNKGLRKIDKKLGYVNIPNAKGVYSYKARVKNGKIINLQSKEGTLIEGEIPVYFDEKGYRKALVPYPKNDTTNLFLGCSFTFGNYITAEESYPYLVSKILENNYVNAAKSGGGIGQMKQLLDTLLAKNNFKYVFIQMSKWLTKRGKRLSYKTYNGKIAYPYFSDDKNGGFILNYPAYTTYYSKRDWTKNSFSYLEKLHFTVTDGFLVEILNYYAYNMAVIKSKLGIINKPTNRKKVLEKYFYNYAIETCRKHKVTPIVLKMSYPNEKCSDLMKLIKSKNVKIIDLDLPLDRVLQLQKRGGYNDYFKIHYQLKNDSIMIDGHPNSYANQLFAKEIIKNLK